MNLGNRHSQHSFAKVPSANTPRSKFDRSFAVKDTFDFDLLTPMFVEEILPGDTINLNVKTFMRLAPQIRPVMDNMYIDFYFFFVPNRLVWTNWERFNGAQDDPGDSTDFLIPTLVGTNFAVGSLFDKFGLPTGVAPTSPAAPINALPFRAYNLIYNEWFRDQNLINSIVIPKGDGPDTTAQYTMRTAAKKHDYFTSALPWPQKGDSISLPIGDSAPVKGIGKYTSAWIAPAQNVYETDGVGTTPYASTSAVFTDNPQLWYVEQDPNNPGYPNIRADLSEATSASINLFRQAMMMQSFLELDARGGTRYVEILRSHFNVVSPDFRLQRPEHLASSTITINQHPIAQTSESTTDNPMGNLAAFSTAQEMGNRIGFAKSFVEHGYVIGLARARAEVTYQQGLPRMWTRQTREDFFWPKFQELGEQAILNQEIFLGTNYDTNNGVFGYQERHAEYRYRPSEIRGEFRSTFAQSLDTWHLAEEFGALPSLNQDFIESSTPIERVLVATENYPHLLADYFFDYKHVRPMVAYPVPASLGRF